MSKRQIEITDLKASISKKSFIMLNSAVSNTNLCSIRLIVGQVKRHYIAEGCWFGNSRTPMKRKK